MITPEQERRLRQLVEVFLREAATINLSAMRTPEACWGGNVLDSLALLDLLPAISMPPRSIRALDVGTGGGFPLLPLALCLPDWDLVGLDATAKKVAAVRRIAAAAGLGNVSLVTGRAEALGEDPRYREDFDLVLSRAVAPLPVLLEYTSPFARPGGHLVLWKSLHIEEELEESGYAQAELAVRLERQHRYVLPGGLGERQLLCFSKHARLSGRYPRGVGVPGKDPLRAHPS